MMSGTLLREHAAKEIKFFDATERVFLHPVRGVNVVGVDLPI